MLYLLRMRQPQYTCCVDVNSVLKSVGGSVTVMISRRHTKPETVRLYVVGAKAPSEDWGFGQDFNAAGAWINERYETNYCEISLAQDEIQKMVALDFVDNKVIEGNKSVLVYLARQNGRKISTTAKLTIVDDRLAAGTYINVISPPEGLEPLTGNGNETNKLNAMISYIQNHGNGKGLLYFPQGTFIFKNVFLPPHLSIIGAGPNKTTIKMDEAQLISNNLSISRATMCLVSTSSAHGLNNGDIVFFMDVRQTEWQHIQTESYGVLVVNSTSFYPLRYFTSNGWKYKVRQLTRGSTTTVKMSYLSSNTYPLPSISDYVYFHGLPSPWNVLNGNHYRVVSVDSNNSTFDIDYDSSGLPGDNSYDDQNIWCALTLNTSNLPEYNGQGGLYLQDEWTRLFTLSASQSYVNTPVAIRNVTLDGNRNRQGPSDFYQTEHQGCIFVNSTSANNTAHCKIESVRFVNSAGDGVYGYHDSMIRGYKLSFDNIRRGSIVCNGYRIDNVFYDLAVTCPYHYNHGRIDYESILSGSTRLEKIDGQMWIQIGTGTGAVNQIVRNFTAVNLYASYIYGYVLVENGHVYCTDNTTTIRDVYGTLDIKNVVFTIGKYTEGIVGGVFLKTSRPGATSFENCQFFLDTSNPPTPPYRCVYTDYFSADTAGPFTFKDCQFGVNFNYGLYVTRGGIFIMDNVSSQAGIMVSVLGYITSYQFPVTITMRGCDPGTGYYLEIRLTTYNAITINHPIEDGQYTTILNAPKNQYIVVNDHLIGSGTITFNGGRYIIGTGNPTEQINGMPGDVYENVQTGTKWTVTSLNNAGWTKPNLTDYKPTIWTQI